MRRLGAGDPVHLDGRWRCFRLGETRIDARMSPPPLVALHKPAGVVVSHDEPSSPDPTLYEAFPDIPDLVDLRAVGRLDARSEGLLLLTADGQLLHRLIHPTTGPARTYLVTLSGSPEEQPLAALRNGSLALRDGHRPAPSRVELLEAAETQEHFGGSLPDGAEDTGPWWIMTLQSGRYHEVRRAFAACGARVERLVRVAYGPLRLARLVPTPGHWTVLPGAERETLYASVGLVPTPTWLETRVERGGTPAS